MTAVLIANRAQLVANAKAYEALVADEIYRLPPDLKKTALETITRTQAWIAVRDINTEGKDDWMPVPQKWAGLADCSIRSYEKNRRGGIDLQQVGQTIGRLGCVEASRNHSAWQVIRQHAQNLGVDLRSGTTMWIINGEDLPYNERLTIDTIIDLAASRLSVDAHSVLSNRLLM